MALKVLMMGGRRCGKTSALSSLFYEIVHGKTNDYLTFADSTVLVPKTNPDTGKKEMQDSLTSKRLELTHFIQTAGNKSFIADAGPTSNFWLYELTVKLPGTSSGMTINFFDAAGEFFTAGERHHEETMKFVKDCDVFVVAIDTPYLMAGKDYENEAANIPDSIHTFLTSIDTTRNKAKQILFVPIKCEKWLQEGKVDDLIQKVLDTYKLTIKDLKISGKTEISIIPIQTAGDILFSELKDPYILIDKSGKRKKCAKVSDRIVILNNGECHKVADGETVEEDPDGVFMTAAIQRPNAWYHLPENHEAKYRPHNCEQIPLHIIRFMFNKLINEPPTTIGDWLRMFMQIFGGITKEKLADTLMKLANDGVIKDNCDGITSVAKCFKPTHKINPS